MKPGARQGGILLCALALTAGCGEEQPAQGADTNRTVSARPDPAPVPDSAIASSAPPAPPTDSMALVLKGEALFRDSRCGRCHTIGQGDQDGPDLRGVTDRRRYDWIVALLTDTETMLQLDPDLQQLRVEHFRDMPNLDLSTADARALYAYLRAASDSIAP